MKVKTLLSVIVVIAASAVGLSLSSRLTQREMTLRRFQMLLYHGEMKLRCGGETLSNAFSDNTFGIIFHERVSFTDQWRSFVSGYRNKITRGDADILYGFADGIGEGDLDAQLQRVELYRSLVDECIHDARDAFERKAKLYRTLSFSTGLVIALILI